MSPFRILTWLPLLLQEFQRPFFFLHGRRALSSFDLAPACNSKQSVKYAAQIRNNKYKAKYEIQFHKLTKHQCILLSWLKLEFAGSAWEMLFADKEQEISLKISFKVYLLFVYLLFVICSFSFEFANFFVIGLFVICCLFVCYLQIKKRNSPSKDLSTIFQSLRSLRNCWVISFDSSMPFSHFQRWQI